MPVDDLKGRKISRGSLLAKVNYKPLRANQKAFRGSKIKKKI